MAAKTSKPDAIFEALRDRILLNKIQPGEIIGEMAVAKEFGVSRTPVRQALQQLASFGFVDIRDGLGTFVTPIDPHDIEQAYQIRCALEKLALESAAYHITRKELDELEAVFKSHVEALEAQSGAVSFDEMAFADWKLHDLIVDRSENRLIAPTAVRITLVLRRYQNRMSPAIFAQAVSTSPSYGASAPRTSRKRR